VEPEERRRVSHVARNPQAVAREGRSAGIMRALVPARDLTAQPAVAGCCARRRKAWLTRWRQAAAVIGPV
jgi:hypothetical protein